MKINWGQVSWCNKPQLHAQFEEAEKWPDSGWVSAGAGLQAQHGRPTDAVWVLAAAGRTGPGISPSHTCPRALEWATNGVPGTPSIWPNCSYGGFTFRSFIYIFSVVCTVHHCWTLGLSLFFCVCFGFGFVWFLFVLCKKVKVPNTPHSCVLENPHQRIILGLVICTRALSQQTTVYSCICL